MLAKYLQKAGILITPEKKNTSYSGLEALKKFLCGIPQSKGQYYLKFGNGLHEVYLQDKYDTAKTLSLTEIKKLDRMVIKLNNHPVAKELFKNSKREDKKYKKWKNGVLLAYILDIQNKIKGKRIGADLKTTSCKTYADCLEKAIQYGYVKQGHIYIVLEKLDEYYLIFICKDEPHDIFIIPFTAFKEQQKYAALEVNFLTYVYKKYGTFVPIENLAK